MARKEIAPTRPEESTCTKCGARVYVVSTEGGKEVELDVSTLEISTVAEVFYGRTLPARWVAKQLSLAWSALELCRRRFIDRAVMGVGGYKLLEPQLFYGTDTQPAAWLWFAKRMELDAAHAERAAIHAEHFTTCEAYRNDRRRLLAELTALHLEGNATGDRRPHQVRLLNLRAQREHAERAHEHDGTSDECARLPAKGRRLKRVSDRFEDGHQLQG